MCDNDKGLTGICVRLFNITIYINFFFNRTTLQQQKKKDEGSHRFLEYEKGTWVQTHDMILRFKACLLWIHFQSLVDNVRVNLSPFDGCRVVIIYHHIQNLKTIHVFEMKYY